MYLESKFGEPLSASWKVPFRAVYCATFASMIGQAFWCHVVLRLFPRATEMSSHDYDAMRDLAPKG
jgi:hypothetical protein